MYKSLLTSLATFAFALGSSTAHAANVEVTVFETISGVSEQVASWTQSENPTPDMYINDYYTTVPVFDATGLGGDADVTWYSGSNGQLGGFTNYSEDFNVLAPTSYAFVESAPTFVPGDYYGVDLKPDLSYLITKYTIAVVPDQPLFRLALTRFTPLTPRVPAAVPEPATWAMMLAGFGMIGFVARRRQRSGVPAV